MLKIYANGAALGQRPKPPCANWMGKASEGIIKSTGETGAYADCVGVYDVFRIYVLGGRRCKLDNPNIAPLLHPRA